jgi:chemotaxis protein CheD
VTLDYLHSADNILVIGVGELVVAEHPSVLVTQALGSCVGLSLWDPIRRAGGMAHIMLPSHVEISREGHPFRFATTAVPTLIDMLADAGSPKARLVAKMAGGAAMFGAESGLPGIGARNIAEVRQQLREASIPVRGDDTGGSHARTIELHLDTGILLVRSYTYGLREV